MTGLRQKVVLITGGSGGLGRVLAQAFLRQGCRVVITSRHHEQLNQAAKKINPNGGQLWPLTCDITERRQVASLEEKIKAQWGTVQILVNNAGLAQAGSFLEMPDRLWDETVKTNLTGAYNSCKVFLPAMIESSWGRIINIASTMAKVAYSHVSAYTASKHGILGLTRALALETATAGITVNAICPGYLDNERTRANAERMGERIGKTVEEVLDLFAKSAPQKRLIAPEEVAGLALFLASEKAGGMTGQAINVDGGAVMI